MALSLTHRSFLAALLALLFAIAIPAAAKADGWTGYAASITPEALVPFDTATGETGEPIEFFNSPRDFTIAPDGKTAYVLGFNPSRVIPVNLATRAEGEAMPIPAGVSKVAITPSGDAVYGAATNSGLIYRLDLATGEVDDPIEVGAQAWDIAITPNGTSIYVNTGSYPSFPASWAGVARVDLATGTVTKVGETGSSMSGIGILPDGSSAYAIGSGLNRVYQVQEDAIVKDFSAGFQAGDIAISPDGTKALATNFSQDSVTVLDLVTNTTGVQIPVGDTPTGIAFAPDSRKSFVTNSSSQDITPIDMTTLTAGAPIPIGGQLRSIAVTPDQPPVASFTASATELGGASAFDASASSDAEGKVTGYEWNFGDGVTATSTSPRINHTYATAGTFTARLTVTGSFACPDAIVFTGQISSCHSNEQKTAEVQVTVRPKQTFCELNPTAPACVPGGGGGGSLPAKLGPLKVVPKTIKLKRRRAVTVNLRIRNTGETATERLKICAKAPRRLVKVTKRCLTTEGISPNGMAQLRFRLRAGKAARRGRKAQVTFRATVAGLPPNVARLRIRFR